MIEDSKSSPAKRTTNAEQKVLFTSYLLILIALDYLVKNSYIAPELALQKAPWEVENINNETNGWVVLSQKKALKVVDAKKSSMMSWISSDRHSGGTG